MSQNYQEILEDKILKPLNMDFTYLNVLKEKFIAVVHVKSNKNVPYSKSIEAWFAVGALKSAISDMAKYLNSHINYSSIDDKVLSKATLLAHEINTVL